MEQNTIKSKRTIVMLDIDGEIIKLTRPSFGEQIKFKEKLDTYKDKENEAFQITVDFLSSCGLDPKYLDVLELETVTELLEMLSGQKKNIA